MITQRFAVEFERRTVGVAARVPGGFIFYTCDDRFNELDGRVFPRARAIERQLKRVVRKGTRNAEALHRDPSFA
jgi:hypothetical protein